MRTYAKLMLSILAIMLFGFSSISQATVTQTATLSGTITYTGSKTGRVYLVANGGSSGTYNLWNVGVSTTLSGSPGSYSGSFTIRGAGIGSYPVRAYLDSTGTGIQHDSDPAGIVYLPSVTGDTTGINITLTDPTPATLAPPTGVGAIKAQNNTANLVKWDPPRQNGLEIAEKYNIYWSSSATGSPLVGQTQIPANGNGMWIHAAAGGTAYYYKVESVRAGSTSMASGWSLAGSLPQGTYSISGTVTYTSVTPTGPLGIAALDENGRSYFVGYATPAANSQSFTIPNLPVGKYGIQGFIDMNNNGLDDAGDLRIKESAGVRVIITTGNVTGLDVNLPTSGAVLQARTGHTLYGETGADSSGEQYQYRLLVSPQLKTPINAALTSAPLSGSGYVVTPVDLGNANEKGRLELNIQGLKKAQAGDSYTVTVTYLEGGSDAYTVLTTAPYNSPPWPLAPIFPVPYSGDSSKGISNGSPVFSWLPPATPPGSWYSYAIWLQDINYNNLWSTDNLPSTVISYDTSSDGFTLPTQNNGYGWTISASDANDNEIQYQAGFVTAQSAPLITGITPASVVPGGTITIKGYNLTSPTSVTVAGTPLTVTSSSSTQITATVPGGFGGPSNPLVVTTAAGSYTWGPASYYGAPLSLGNPTTHIGQVVDNAGTGINGVTVTMVGNPAITATIDGSGNFTLNNLPNNTATPFSLRFMVNGKQPHYTKKMWMQPGGSSTASFPYKMRTYTELNSLSGMTTPGKGAVSTRVLVQGTSTPIEGATVTAVGSSGTTYVAQYYNGTNYTGTSTSVAGGGVVLFANVNHGDKLTINATAPGYSFSPISSTGVAEASTSGGIGGVLAAPTVSGFSPGSGVVGTTITITGTNFTNVLSVSFGGTPAPYVVNSPTQITASVPFGAVSGVITVTTQTGNAFSSSSFTVLTPYTLTVTPSGYGAGTVTSNVGGINCPGTCTAQISSGTSVTLTATPHLPESSFGGWSNACTSEPCTFTMNSDKTAIATFTLKQLKNIDKTDAYYDYLSDALTDAANGNEVRAHDSLIAPSLSYNRAGVSVKIAGGYDNAFTSRNSPSTTYTDITSPLTIQTGTLILDQIIVK